jgi:hypothetical protein
MPMLNPLGATPQPGLSMPGGMPGGGGPSDPMAGAGGPPPPVAPMLPPPPPAGGPPGGAPTGPAGFPGVGMVDPAGRQYETVTQEDGSILLHVKNPDGTRGPAVKIIPPIKPRGGASGGAQ